MGANWTLTILPYAFASVVDESLGSRLTVCDMFLDELHGKIKLKRFPSSQFTQFRSKVRHLIGMVFGKRTTLVNAANDAIATEPIGRRPGSSPRRQVAK